MQQSLYILFLLIVALMTGCSGSSGPQMSDSEISAGQISTYQLKQQVSLYEKALEDPAATAATTTPCACQSFRRCLPRRAPS